MEGLDFKDKEDLFIFSDSSVFIESYKSLLNDAIYTAMATSAFNTLEKNYSQNLFETLMNKNWEVISN